jgi:predicted nucleic acid-binding protein
MSRTKQVLYWDSSVFCSFFNAHNEKERAKLIRELLDEAQSGSLDIVTSTIALVEVVKLDGERKLPREHEDKIAAFFEYPFIHLIEIDRTLCEDARKLIWEHPSLFPKDAIHLASAIFYATKAPLSGLFSYDEDFIKLDGKLTKQFSITEPFMSQGLLGLSSAESPEPTQSEKPDDEISN